ncbi:MAG: AAA family ATPase [Anaerolineales bacterium]|nr:AAA family ATPase [Anaerolineales bacterium]
MNRRKNVDFIQAKQTMTAPYQLRLKLLGELQVFRNAETITNQLPRKGLALLAYLAVTNRPHSRSVLAELLWSDFPEQRARKNLRDLLAALRPLASPWLLITHTNVRFSPTNMPECDLHPFLDTIQQRTPQVEQLADALQRYEGEFLAGFYVRKAAIFEEWAALQREYLHQQALAGLENLVDQYYSGGQLEVGLQAAARLLTLDPWQESSHRRMMQLYAAKGEISSALRQYERCKDLLAAELGIKPAHETTTLAATLRQQLERKSGAAHLPTASATESIQHNLPAELLAFFGREVELAQLGEYVMTDHARLTTILGLGGMGKTRLALAFARQMITNERFPNGVYFVNLQGVENASHLWDACAKAVGTPLSPVESPLPQLVRFLSTKQLLLILDNFEQLISAAAELQHLLHNTQLLQVVVTSRIRLPLQYSAILHLRGLSFPATDAEIEDCRYSALDLLEDRFTRNSNRPLSVSEVQALRQIARLTAGMPLAMELAAAWEDTLTAAEIVEQLATDISFLHTNLHDIPTRQQHLSAVFEASWQHLSRIEQELMIKLAHFGVSFSRKDAQTITTAPLALFASLVRKSLLHHDRVNGRYQMHPLIRQFCRDKGEVSTFVHTLREAHSDHYGRILQGQLSSLLGAAQTAAIRRIHLDWTNFQQAWLWAVEHRNNPRLQGMVHSLGNYCLLSGQYRAGRQLFAAAVTTLTDAAPDQPLSLAICLAWQAMFARQLSDIDDAKKLLQMAQHYLNDPTLHHRNTRFVRGFIWRQLGNIASHRQEIDKAIDYYERALELLLQEEDQTWIMAVCQNLGNTLLYGQGNASRAADVCALGMENARSMGDKGGIAWMLLQEKAILEHQGDFAVARLHGEEAFRLFMENGNPFEITMAQERLVFNQYLQGEFPAAAEQIPPIIAAYEQLSQRESYARAQNLQAHIALHQGNWNLARQIWQKLRQHELLIWRNQAQLGLAQMALADSHPRDAAQLLSPVVAYWREINNLYQLMETLAVTCYLPEEVLSGLQFSSAALFSEIENAGIAYSMMLATPAQALRQNEQGDNAKAVGIYQCAISHAFVSNSRWIAEMCREWAHVLARRSLF